MAQNGRTVQVSGDYNIKTGEGNTILLDTSGGGQSTAGSVIVTGNLEVRGETLTVEAENLNVKDNIIILNFGETGPGVSLDYSGIQIARGETAIVPPGGNPADYDGLGDAGLYYDESTNTWEFVHGNPGFGFSYVASKLRLKEILTDPDTDDGNLILLGASSSGGLVTVEGTLNYEDRVAADLVGNSIPNKKYVDEAIINTPTFQIIKDDTRVISFDINSTLPLTSFPIGPYPDQPLASEIGFVVDNTRVGFFTSEFFKTTGLKILSESATGTDANATLTGNSTSENFQASVIRADNNVNLRLETSSTGKVVINNAMSLEYTGVAFSNVANTTVFWGATPGAGTTGIKFINNTPSGALAYTEGELISKERALLFSMLF
jgi:hypothetical protein